MNAFFQNSVYLYGVDPQNLVLWLGNTIQLDYIVRGRGRFEGDFSSWPLITFLSAITIVSSLKERGHGV